MEPTEQNFWGVPDHASDTANYYARQLQASLAALADLPNLLLRPVTPRGDITYADLLPGPVRDVLLELMDTESEIIDPMNVRLLAALRDTGLAS